MFSFLVTLKFSISGMTKAVWEPLRSFKTCKDKSFHGSGVFVPPALLQ
jgi:hypothetical protein